MDLPEDTKMGGAASARSSPCPGGYTLVEVLLAVIVFGIGVVGTLGFFTSGAIFLNVENHKRTAAEIAYSRQEELRTVSFPGLPSYQEEGHAVELDGLPGFRNTVVEDVDEDGDGTVDYRSVTVTVKWVEGSARQVELVTLRSRHR